MNTKAWLRGSLFALPMLSAQAGAPMTTEDAGVLTAKACEWESVAERTRVAMMRGDGVRTGVACQLFEGSQLGLGVSRTKADGQAVRSLVLAGKTALVDGDGPALSLAWSVDAIQQAGERLRQDGSSLALVASHQLNAWSLHANLGWSRSRQADEAAGFWAVGVEWALNEAVQLLAEQYGARHNKPAWGLGLRWQPSPDWALGLMHSRSRDQAASRGWLLSAKLSF